MIAAFMFGRTTFHSRCHALAPSTLAASRMSSGTWTSPASSSSEMNGVVFQISDNVMTNSDDHRSPNQLKSLEAEPLVHEPRVERNA